MLSGGNFPMHPNLPHQLPPSPSPTLELSTARTFLTPSSQHVEVTTSSSAVLQRREGRVEI